jgi:LysM repeat protein
MPSAPLPPSDAPIRAAPDAAAAVHPLDAPLVVRGVAPSTTTIEMPVYVPGEWIDDAPRDLPSPTRGLRPRRRSTVQRVLIALSSGTALLALAGVLALATIFSPIGSRRTARAAAEQELKAELEDGEKILSRAYVSQRNWWDNYRESFGVLAATDRRLIFVGMPPASWIHGTDDDGPPELRVQSFPYDAPFTATTHRLLLGTTPGVVVQTTSGAQSFLVPRGERARVQDIEQVVERAQIAGGEALALEQQQRTAPPPAPTVYVTHVVRYGESVTSIARRYRTTNAAIRELNRLPNDRIRAGQRLRVPQVPGADSTAAP